MRKMESGELKVDCLNFCIYNFGELLQVMAKVERWEDIIRIGNFIKDAPNFSGSICPVYKIMCQAARRSEKEEIRSQVHKYERMYLEALEKEKENYDELLRASGEGGASPCKPEGYHEKGSSYRMPE